MMKHEEKLVQLGITDKELQDTIRGAYQPGFMQIRLAQPFDGNLGELKDSELGVLLHEYIHYLQNVSTPWGLYSSMVGYEIMTNTYKFIESSTEEIQLPIKLNYGEKLNTRIEIVKLGVGDIPLQKWKYNTIDRSEKIKWHRKLIPIGTKNFPEIVLYVKLANNTNREVCLGANIINESMAALYQMQIDSTATHPENDLPYNLIKIISEQHFSNIASDDVKLITICYISLFSLSPAESLISQLDYANNNPNLCAKEIFEHFVNYGNIRVNQNEEMPISAFFDDIIHRFKNVLSKALKVELDYIDEVLERVKLSNNIVPILSVLFDGKLTKDKIETIINYLGTPYTYTDTGNYYTPNSAKDLTKKSDDMIALIGHHALFHYLVKPNEWRCCPLKYICIKEGKEKEECFDEPWNGEECPMTVVGSLIDMKSKTFSWKNNS